MFLELAKCKKIESGCFVNTTDNTLEQINKVSSISCEQEPLCKQPLVTMRFAVSFVLIFGLACGGFATNLRANNFLRVDGKTKPCSLKLTKGYGLLLYRSKNHLGKNFMYGNDVVYLSGTNAAWIQYGNDFGNGQWDSSTGSLGTIAFVNHETFVKA